MSTGNQLDWQTLGSQPIIPPTALGLTNSDSSTTVTISSIQGSSIRQPRKMLFKNITSIYIHAKTVTEYGVLLITQEFDTYV